MARMENSDDLALELRKIVPGGIDSFIESHIDDLCAMVKPGNHVVCFEEGYFCSGCSSQLSDEEASFHYCSNCTVPFDCCDEEDGHCVVCGAKAEELVRKTYQEIRSV